MLLPPSDVAAFQVSPTTPEAVTAALFARLIGASGIAAALMETSFEKVVL